MPILCGNTSGKIEAGRTASTIRRIHMILKKIDHSLFQKRNQKIRVGIPLSDVCHELFRRGFHISEHSKELFLMSYKQIDPPVEHGFTDRIFSAYGFNGHLTIVIITQYLKQEQNAVLTVRNDGIWKDGMCMTASPAFDTYHSDFGINSFPINESNGISRIPAVYFASESSSA